MPVNSCVDLMYVCLSGFDLCQEVAAKLEETKRKEKEAAEAKQREEDEGKRMLAAESQVKPQTPVGGDSGAAVAIPEPASGAASPSGTPILTPALPQQTPPAVSSVTESAPAAAPVPAPAAVSQTV